MCPGDRHKPVIEPSDTVDPLCVGLDIRLKCVGIPYHSTDFLLEIGPVRSYH